MQLTAALARDLAVRVRPAVGPRPLALPQAFRRTVFLHQDGFILTLLLGAIQERHLLEFMLERGSVTVAELTAFCSANEAYLHVALRCLAQQGWVTRNGSPGTEALTYQVTDGLRRIQAFLPLYTDVATFLRPWLPLDASLFTTADPTAIQAFDQLVERVRTGWSLETAESCPAPVTPREVRHHLTGALAVSLMVALRKLGFLANLSTLRETSSAFCGTWELFEGLGWIDPETSDWSKDGILACNHALYFGMVGSYLPMLVRLPSLLFGLPCHQTHEVPVQ